jgi:hypothetical protein
MTMTTVGAEPLGVEPVGVGEPMDDEPPPQPTAKTPPPRRRRPARNRFIRFVLRGMGEQEAYRYVVP